MQCLLFLIFLANVFAFNYAASPRSVNLALDTVLEFDNKNDVHFIRTLQQFLDKLKITITRSNPDMGDIVSESEDKTNVKITDFFKEMLSVVSSYNDKELKKFAKTLEDEIKAWLDRNKIFDTAEFGFRNAIDDTLKEFSNLPVKEIRRKLKRMSRRLNYSKRNRHNGILANFLNYFYINESKAKISNFVKNLKLYRAQTRRGIFHLNLKRIIRSGIENIIEPIMQLGAALRDIQIENIRDDTEPEKPSGSIKFKDLFKNFVHKSHEEDKENEILDYIDSYKRVVDKHITTSEFLRDTKAKSETKKYKTTTTITNKYSRTTKNKRNYKPIQSSIEELESKLREKISRKRTTIKTSKKEILDEIDDRSESNDFSNVKEPFLIKIGSSDGSETDEEMTITPQHTKQRRYKKFTRSQTTTRKPFTFFKKSNKYRKSLVTTVSDEGLSIEHFGSLVIPKSYRKSNDNDTFIKNTSNISHNAENVVNKSVSTEIIDDNVSKNVGRLNIKDQSNDVKQINKTAVTIQDSKSDLDKYSVTKTINLKGNFFIDKPFNITNQNTISLQIISNDTNYNELTTEKSLNDIQTKYYNVKKIKPTINLRSHKLNGTDLTTNPNSGTTKLFNLTTVKSPESIDTKKEDVAVKPEDGLENELENIIDKFNASSTMPIEFDNFLKETKNNENNIKDQMKADLAKLLMPTTENAVTELYTDPFSELDAIDLIK